VVHHTPVHNVPFLRLFYPHPPTFSRAPKGPQDERLHPWGNVLRGHEWEAP
jgi:hypothetical protein